MIKVETEFNRILDIMEIEVGFSTDDTDYTLKMMNQLILAYYQGIRLSYCHWLEGYSDRTKFNLIIRLLSSLGWIKTIIVNNYATIELKESKLFEFYSAQEISDMRLDYLVNNKVMQCTLPNKNNLSCVRMPSLAGGTKKIKMKNNIIREGFRLSGCVPFSLDTWYLEMYRDEFHYELTKGLQEVEKLDKELSRRKPLDKEDYREVVQGVFDYYLEADREYTFGENISDSRGRAIYSCLSKVGNPISSKLFRSILKVKPVKITEDQLDEVYKFIADLAGVEYETIEDKIGKGLYAYMNKLKGKELWETIWLDRLYKGLDFWTIDNDYLWDIPIEIDK